MSFVPNPADIEIIEQAAQILDEESLALRMAHTKPPEHADWVGEEATKLAYDSMKEQVGKLYDLAARMGGT